MTFLNFLSLQGRGSSLSNLSLLSLTLVQTLSQQLGVLSSSISLGLSVLNLQGLQVSLSLQNLWSDQSLDLWSLGVLLLTLDNLSSDNVLSNVILLGQTEELSDVVSSLWTQSLWNLDISQTLELVVTLLDDNKGQDGEIWTNNGTSDRLSLSLTNSSWSVTRVTLSEQQLDTVWQQDTLLHWETLLVVTTGDLEDVTLELITDRLTIDFLTDSLLVEDTQTVVIINLKGLLGPVGWVGNVQLKLVLVFYKTDEDNV
jgi:uncharacterized protein YaaW (UPF0174 family)